MRSYHRGSGGRAGGGFGRPDGERPGDASSDALAGYAMRLASFLVEILDGRRDARHLDGHVTPAVGLRIRHWARRPGGLPTPGGTARLRSSALRVIGVHADRVHDDAFEAAVLVEQGGWYRAIAVRLDHRQGHWRASDLAPPECGLDALPLVPRIALAPRPDAFDETVGVDAGGPERHPATGGPDDEWLD